MAPKNKFTKEEMAAAALRVLRVRGVDGLTAKTIADEISEAASTWLAGKNDDLADCLQKLTLVDDAYQELLTDNARDLLDSAGCADVDITWGSEPVAAVEAVMQAAGLRG